MARGIPSLVAQVAALAAPDGQPAVLGIVGAGGSDAPAVVQAAVALLADHGAGVLRATGRRLERDDPLGAVSELVGATAGATPSDTERTARDLVLDRMASGPRALVVEDAQWLDPASLRVLVGVVERAADRGLSVVVSHRPVPGDAALAALDAALGRRQPIAVLRPLDEAAVAERAALVLESAVDQQLVEALTEQAAGVPALVEGLARAWASSGLVTGGHLTARPGDGPGEPALVEYLRAEIDQLPPAARTALAALSAGADLDDELLRRVTGLVEDQLGEAVTDLRAAGLLTEGEEVVPVVAAAMVALTPEPDRRRFHARLADALIARGAPPMQAAEHLAAAGAKGRAAGDAYVAAGESLLGESPELARQWFDRAVDAGIPPPEVAARQAEAAALDGDTASALRLADRAAAEPGAAEPDRARAVVAGLLPARGLWRRSAQAYDELAATSGPRSDAAAVLAAIGTLATGGPLPAVEGAEVGNGAGHDGPAHDGMAGDGVAHGDDTGAGPAGAPGAAALVAAARSRLAVTAPLGVEALALTAEGVAATLGEGAGASLAAFIEAAELLESGHDRLVLPDTPHALGAVTALALCEQTTAEHLLTRALDHGVGGPALADRHRLLLGWVGLRNGRWALAQATLDEVEGHDLVPRDVLVAAAIQAGLARRSGDLAGLSAAWGRAEPVLVRHPADLFSLEVVGELSVSASRLGLWDRITGKARELGDIVRALGSPPLWLLPLRWAGLQAALAGDDTSAAARRAAEVQEVAPAHPRLRGLATAAAAWVTVLEGTVDADQVQAAAGQLAALGLPWEASRLTGQAAIRSGDPSVTRSLLEHARDLKAALPSGDAGEVPTAASVLSEREQTVAQYVVDGLTHKEIGAQLYISPKTVEHHVAKIRQKLGASTRAEMLAALRTQLSS